MINYDVADIFRPFCKPANLSKKLNESELLQSKVNIFLENLSANRMYLTKSAAEDLILEIKKLTNNCIEEHFKEFENEETK